MGYVPFYNACENEYDGKHQIGKEKGDGWMYDHSMGTWNGPGHSEVCNGNQG